MTISYVVRTIKGVSVCAFDDLTRAQSALRDAEKRIGCRMQLVKITHQEEIIHAA